MKEEFRYIIGEWMGQRLPETIEREMELDLDAKKVIAIAGVRRSGKTYMLFETIKRLLKRGVPRENILYVNFDDDRLQGAGTKELGEMLDAYGEIAAPKDGAAVFLLLDEIQNVRGWELWIRRIYDTGRYRIFITGSSSKLLSREIATALVGRNITYVMYPFSLREFLLSKGIVAMKRELYSADMPRIERYAREYLIWGGFPEVAMAEKEETKQRILSSYYDAILYRDIMTRYKIKDANRLSMVFRYAISAYGSGFSTVKLYNYFKSQNISLSRQTINNFIKFGEQTFLFYQLMQFFKGFKRSNQSRKKLYVVDNGIAGLFASAPEYGRLLESAVYIELLRRKERDPSLEINYLNDKDGEVDFIVSRKGVILQAIQVTYELNASNREREIRPLIRAIEKCKPERSILISFNPPGKELTIEKGIDVVSFVRWAITAP